MQDAIDEWKARMTSSDREMYRWLRQKPAPPSMTVYDDTRDDGEHQAATAEPDEVFQHIETFWQRIWQRPIEEMGPEEYLAQYGPPRAEPLRWVPVTGPELHVAARKQRSKSGGV